MVSRCGYVLRWGGGWPASHCSVASGDLDCARRQHASDSSLASALRTSARRHRGHSLCCWEPRLLSSAHIMLLPQRSAFCPNSTGILLPSFRRSRGRCPAWRRLGSWVRRYATQNAACRVRRGSPSIFATLYYGGATVAMLVMLRSDQVSELQGLTQAGNAAAAALGARWLSPVIAVLVFSSALGQFGALGSSTARLPFAAGVDGLMPRAFGRIHPRWNTPHVSILTLGAIASALLLFMQVGDTARAAYDALVSLMVIVGFVPYIYMFGSSWKAGNRISAASGPGDHPDRHTCVDRASGRGYACVDLRRQTGDRHRWCLSGRRG